MKSIVATLGALLFAAALYPASPAIADAAFEMSPPQSNYPLDLTFGVEVSSDQQITELTLRFTLTNRGLSGFGRPESFTPGTDIQTSVVVDTNPDTNWLPIGNEFMYHWEATLADGSVVESPEESFLYLPPGRDWVEVRNDLMTVYYFGERTNTANRFLDAAEDTYAEVGVALLKASLEHLPVKVILFVTPEEIAESQPSKGSTFEAASIVTCGFRPGSADDIVIVGASCGGGDSVDTLRHEFGHILTAIAGESPLVRLPSWIDEGLAVFAQEENGFESSFQSRIRREELLSFDRLGRPPSDPADTLLFYGQSHAMVTYLLDVFGNDKMAELMSLTKAGTRFDVAFEQTFGMDMTGFEEEFREAMGLPASQPIPDGEPTNAPQQPSDPTATPADSSRTISGSSDDGIDPFVVGSIGAAVLFALGAVLLVLLAQILGNRRAAALAAQPSPAVTASPPSRQDGPVDDTPADNSPHDSDWGRPD